MQLIVAAASAVVIPGNAPLSAGALAFAAPPEAEPGNEISEESERYIAALRGLQTDCAELGKDHAFASKSREAVPLRAQAQPLLTLITSPPLRNVSARSLSFDMQLHACR